MSSLADRFWAMTIPEPNSGCWLWMGAIDRKGYGQTSRPGFRRVVASRLAYELGNGPIPPGMFVCHSCDNRACCNPGHLFLGTHLENMADMRSKGRSGRRGRSPTRKLTAPQVIEIRSLVLTGGLSRVAVARRFGVSHTSINSIVSRKTWTEV